MSSRSLQTTSDNVEGIDFRNAMSRWASGVTVVCASGADGPVGLTASSFSSLSLDPPLIVVCVASSWNGHDALIEAPGFSVHLLGAGQRELSDRFAGAVEDKFAGLPHEVGRFDAPLLDYGLARLVCAHESALPGGDHTILVGRVVCAELRGPVTQAPEPLVHYARDYHRLASATDRPLSGAT